MTDRSRLDKLRRERASAEKAAVKALAQGPLDAYDRAVNKLVDLDRRIHRLCQVEASTPLVEPPADELTQACVEALAEPGSAQLRDLAVQVVRRRVEAFPWDVELQVVLAFLVKMGENPRV